MEGRPPPVNGITVIPGSPCLVQFVGEFDIADTDEVLRTLARIPDGDLRLDLREVSFCSSALLSALLTVRRQRGQCGHHVTLVGASAVVTRLLALTGTLELFPVVPD